MEHLSTSLRDTDDIRQSAHLIVTKLVAGWPGHVAAHLDAILTPITTTLREKVKAKAGQDDETLRSGIRAILACGRVQDIVTARRFHVRALASSCVHPAVQPSSQCVCSHMRARALRRRWSCWQRTMCCALR